MRLSIVLPCYNEAANIEATVLGVHRWMGERGMDGEIIVVDDGSRDHSPQILERLQREIVSLRVVRHAKNGGYGIAVRSGCDAATSEWIAFMDSDGQFRVEDLALLLKHTDRFSFVTGRRAHRADSFVRNMLGKILGAMNVLIFQLWVRDVNCGLKLFRRDLWMDIRPTHGVEKLFNTEMFLRLKRKSIPWHQVNVPHYPRRAGKPTGAKWSVILRMFRELWELKTSLATE